MGRNTHRPEIQRRRRRRAKIQKLKARIAKTTSPEKIQALVEKIRTISPKYPLQQSAPAGRARSAA